MCIAGPGAVGTTLGARLALKGHAVAVVARAESARAIRTNGLRLIDSSGEHRVAVTVLEPNEARPQDVIFLCPKAQDLASLAASVEPLIGEETLIVPVINGIPWWYFEGEQSRYAGRLINAVDADGTIKRLLPLKQVIGCVAVMTADRIAAGFARSLNPMRLTIGEIDNRITGRIERLAGTLSDCGIAARVSPRIRDALWTKVILNLISNPLSVVAGATLRDICADPALSRITRQLIDEALLTAASYGARVECDVRSLLELGASMGDTKTSMLQDFEKGAPLELQAICDSVLELAEIQGLQMPLTRNIAILARYRSALASNSAAE